ncbi:MAG: hypothetical protein KF773_33945, partial [Deltaproteobacteria bacterium]|nr:hypothetical protein [Deltaproteobacteria bacterium]
RTKARAVRAHARGHLGRVLEALEDAQHARAGCAEAGDVRATAHASLDECALLDRASRSNEAAAAAIMARTLIIQLAGPIPRADDPERDNVALRARLAHAEGRALARIGRHRDAKGLLGVAVAFGAKLETVAGRETELDARLLLASEHVALGALDAADAELETVFTYAHASNDLPRISAAHDARALVRCARRDLDGAEADLAAAIELARELRDDALEYRARYHRGELLIWRDRLDDAVASARRAFELCAAAPVPHAGILLARVAVARGDLASLDSHLQWVATTFPDDEIPVDVRLFRDAARASLDRARSPAWDRIVAEAGTIGLTVNARLEIFLAALAGTADAAARADLRRAALALTEDPSWRARLRAAG